MAQDGTAPAEPVLMQAPPQPAQSTPISPDASVPADAVVSAPEGQGAAGASLPLPPQAANEPAAEGQPQLAAPTEPAAPAPAQITQGVETPAAPVPTFETVLAGRLSTQREDAELAAFYVERGNKPLWIENGKLSSKAADIVARISRADEDGLQASSFVLPDPGGTDTSLEAETAAEVALSRAAIAYAREAEGGRIDPARVSPLVTPEISRTPGRDILAALAADADPAARLAAYNPPHPGFAALKARLVELRRDQQDADTGPAPIPPGPVLKPGMSDERVPLLRAKFALPAAGDTVYDPALVDAVKAFQKGAGLRQDGLLGARSLALLNGEASSPEDEIKLVLVNMERWRWLPRDLGSTHVMVNVPEYMARITRENAVVHETRVIVGKPIHQTPIFSHQMQFIIVNPAWNVPSSIATKEMLPNLLRDPTYLARQGMEVLDTSGRKPVVIDSTSVDWSRVNMNRIRIRQPPGERNALGHIKFMFPNKHAVYLHDTPSRGLFANAQRAYSHGCVRVQDPFALADVLLEGSNWNADKMKKLIGQKGERRINLAHNVPIHIVYFTAELAADGRLVKRADIYGHDRRMAALMGLNGQAQASVRGR
ncbi:L,D-transpeptidase family protein [Terrihabitans sp. PJ23]|uniref:L,D-transpeptidase family protein n=1 Tax=Terrihabitans rhizophilus TaxID=3092662 RepID=A0ABU4RSM8_9HYPH|nr:L,D-transpeptidase family protein [Terrihabitans sp. PJ23]